MKIRPCVHRSLYLFFLACLPDSLAAQSPLVAECHIAPDTIQSPIRQIPIYETRGGGSFNGCGGIDVLKRTGPGTFVPRPEAYISIEPIDLKNRVFDTVVVNAEMIRSTELGELEIVADWYDQIILDPMLTWNRSVDAAFISQLFSPDGVEFPAILRTPLEAFVIGAPTMMMQTQEGPLGHFSIEASGDPDVSTAVGQPPSITLSWPGGGFITPNLSDVRPVTETMVFNLRNRRPDSIVIDPFALAGTVPRKIIMESDASDRWIMMQNECWQPIGNNLDTGPNFVFDAGQPTEVILINAENYQIDQQISVFTQGVVDVPDYRHLSANSRYTVDAIDLRNGGKDVLILRNDRHLRQG